MNEKSLKDMWNKTENLLGESEYERSTIERFISGRSTSVAEKIKKMLQIDIVLKLLFALVLLIDALVYFSIQPEVSIVCGTGIIIVIMLTFLQFNILKRFNQISDYGQDTKEKLSQMLSFLRNGFFKVILNICTTYIFLYISGVLMYFYLTYGELRRLGNLDIFVFSGFMLIGVGMNFAAYLGQTKYHIRHIEACLSDLNDNILAVITSNIETQLKQDRIAKMFFGFLLVLGFFALIFILKKLGI